jgi:hypothetical protein
LYSNRNAFDITNISIDYTNALRVEFEYNGNSDTIEIPVEIFPNVQLHSNPYLKQIYYSDSDLIPASPPDERGII